MQQRIFKYVILYNHQSFQLLLTLHQKFKFIYISGSKINKVSQTQILSVQISLQMKLKQKQSSRKNVHMPIQPIQTNKNSLDKLPTEKIAKYGLQSKSPFILNSPDSLLPQNDENGQQDEIIQDQENANRSKHAKVLSQRTTFNIEESEVGEKNVVNSKNLIQKQEQIKDKIVSNYIYDHYEFILRPIALNLIQYSIVFLFIFMVIKVFWIYQDIFARKDSQQTYLKNLMYQRIIQIEIQSGHSYQFLSAVNQIYSQATSSYVFTQKKQLKCEDFSPRYLCAQNQNYSIIFYKLVDQNYDILSSEFAFLLSHINAANLFAFSLEDDTIIEFNITAIFNSELPDNISAQTDSLLSSLSSSQVNLVSQYIKNYQDQSSKQFFSQLSSQFEHKQVYQWWQLYLFDQNQTKLSIQTYNQKFDIYCFPLNINFNNTKKRGKTCLSLESSNKLQNSENILFIKTQFSKIKIKNNQISALIQNDTEINQLSDIFRRFIQSKVSPVYAEYKIDMQYISQCLHFHDQFYQEFADSYLQLEVFRCYHSQYMHMLISKYIFSWSILQIQTISYKYAPYSIDHQSKLQIESFIFSNFTYFKDVHQISNNGIQIIQNIIKVYAFLLIAIILSYQASKIIIHSKLLQPFSIIKNLAKIVMNNKDIKQSQTNFSKIISELQQQSETSKTFTFGILICYLRKFLWIKKIYFCNKKNASKDYQRMILLQGLLFFKYLNQTKISCRRPQKKEINWLKPYDAIKIFMCKQKKKFFEDCKEQGSSNQQDIIRNQIILMNYLKNPSVLIYIYEELINLQLQNIENLKNIKVLSKKRESVKRKSGQMHILHEIQNDSPEEPNKIHYQKQQNDFFGLQSNYDQDIPQISIMQNKPRQNKGVRFSNQIQFKGLNQEQKKSKFRQNIRSNSSIGKKSSLKSLRSIDSQAKKRIDDIQKISKSQQDSNVQSTSKKIKRQTTIKNILMGENSIHQELKTMKFDDNSNSYDEKYSNMNHKYELGQQEFEQNQMQLSVDQFCYTPLKIFEDVSKSYINIIAHYEQLIDIHQKNLKRLKNKRLISFEEQQQKVNEMYNIEITRLKICYKYLKILLQQSKGQQVDFQKKGINFDFDRLTDYQDNYEIKQQFLDKCSLQKMKISICLGKTISYKQLQEICLSENIQICLESNFLYAQQLSKLQPYLDFQVVTNCINSLCNYQTNINFKRKTLQLIIKTLGRTRDQFLPQIQELQLIKRFYNRKHKKFYFIADLTQSYDIFTPILTKIYELMNRTDLMQIYNLGMSENLSSMNLMRQNIKMQSVQTFLQLFEHLTSQSQKSKDKNSSKLIHKRLVYENDFNEILDQIQKDETQFSSFLVIILGGDQVSNHSSSIVDDADSSNNQRQLNQLLHSEINRKIEKNYYHIILLGTHLNNFMTKQGKLKKHIKNSFDLLQIDLAKKNIAEHFAELEKFISQ